MKKIIFIAWLLFFAFISCNEKDANDEVKIQERAKPAKDGRKSLFLLTTSEKPITAILRFSYPDTLDGSFYYITHKYENIILGDEIFLGYKGIDFITCNKYKAYYTKNEGNSSIIQTALTLCLGAILTGIASFLSIRGGARNKRKYIGENELKLLLKELQDIQRHIRENLKVISRISISERIPSTFHLKKMKPYEYTLLFNAETFKLLPSDSKITEGLIRVRLAIRNIHTEIDGFVHYIESGDGDKEIIDKYMDLIKAKCVYAYRKVATEIKLLDPDYSYRLNNDITKLSKEKQKEEEDIDTILRNDDILNLLTNIIYEQPIKKKP
ncbi:MAG TPA: hypothetical protein VGD89_08335, partial [Flavipsychrobacter sp.]